MSQFKLATRDNATHFKPGEEIAGASGWKLEAPVDWIEIRLFWYTDGKGSEDLEVVDIVRFDQPRPEEARPFRFLAPAFPYSFSGTLISLMWALEIVPASGQGSSRVDLVISPTGEEIRLEAHEGT